MLQNYLKTAIRNLFRHKLYTFIKFFGLAIALAFVLLMYLFIRHELSYDRFHENADRLYRINEVEIMKSGVEEQKDLFGYDKSHPDIRKYPYLPPPMGEALLAEIPEVVQYSRLDFGGAVVRQGNRVFEEEVKFVDDNFFQLFSFPLIEGNEEQVLMKKNSVVLTPETAEKYFGSRNPIGEQLFIKTYEEEEVYTVTGIAAPAPANSSLQFEILAPYENKPFYEKKKDDWNSFNSVLMVELAPQADPKSLEPKLETFTKRHWPEFLESARTRRNLSEEEAALQITLTPLTAIHLDSSVFWDGQGNPLNILILSGITLLILIIACLNYISLSLATSSSRVKEIGIRKVVGGSRGQVARQFWVEVQLLVLIAVGASIVVAELFLPVFNRFVQRTLYFDLAGNWTLLLALLAIALLTGLLAGGYPAVVLSRFRPVQVLRGTGTYRYQPRFIKGAVVVQFALSAFLITSSIIMYRQMQFINQKELGFDKEQVVVLRTHTGWEEEGERLMNLMEEELLGQSNILSITGTNNSFNQGWDRNGYETADGEQHSVFVYRVDPGYIPVLGIDLIAGRNFSEGRPADITDAIIVNEALVEDLGLEQPIGAAVPWRDSNNRQIIGVVENYHFLPLNHDIPPALLHINPEEGKINNLLIKLSGRELPEALASIEQSWRKLAPELPFDYTFLDEDVAQQYDAYLRWMSILGYATLFAIFIACFGLFGLAGILAFNRTREIGIRKVFGASLADVLGLLNKDLIKLAVLAMVTGGPIAWYVMRQWLNNFEYKVSISWTTFALAAACCIGVALLAVSYHTLQAALRNPVKSLRYE